MSYSLHFLKKEGLYENVKALLLKHITGPIEILRTENGKPYLEGNPVYFSLSHSGDKAVAAISKAPVGVDLELFTGKSRGALLKRFSERERAEIEDERGFLRHWTAREAYIKLKGLILAQTFKRLEFYGGELYLDGAYVGVNIDFYEKAGGVIAVCTEK